MPRYKREKKEICQRCGRWFRHRSSYAYYCEPCRPLVKLERSRAWEAAHPERVKAKAKAWRQANPERLKHLQRLSYRRHASEANARSRRYYAANAETLRAKKRAKDAAKLAAIRQRLRKLTSPSRREKS